MDPISASVVVGLLARYAHHLAGHAQAAVDDAVKDQLARLWEAVRTRFQRDPHAAHALDRVAEDPGNELRQAALQDYLAQSMQADRDFRVELVRLAQPVITTTSTVDVQDSGAVAAGGTVNITGQIAAGRDVLRSAATGKATGKASP
jgi:hypothetical protein